MEAQTIEKTLDVLLEVDPRAEVNTEPLRRWVQTATEVRVSRVKFIEVLDRRAGGAGRLARHDRIQQNLSQGMLRWTEDSGKYRASP